MSRQQRGGFWGNLFGTAPAHERFSVEELQVGDGRRAVLLLGQPGRLPSGCPALRLCSDLAPTDAWLLQYLHGVLLKNPVIADANRDTVVEALRSIAELVIWWVLRGWMGRLPSSSLQNLAAAHAAAALLGAT